MSIDNQMVHVNRDDRSGQTPTDIQVGGPRNYQGMPEPEQETASPVAQVHRILRGRYKWAFLLAMVAGAIGAVAGWLSVTPKYNSSGLIRVQPQLDPYLFSNDATKPVPMFNSFMAAQAQVIRSRRVVERAMRSDAWQAVSKATDDEAVAEFNKGLRVNTSGQIIYVRFSDEEPRKAMRGVQSTINSYMEIFGERDQLEDAKRLQALEDRRTKLTAELTSSDQRIQALAHIYGTDDLTSIYEAKLEQVNRHESELNRVIRAIADLEATLGEEDAIDNTIAEYTVEEIAVYDPKMANLLTRREALNRQIEMLRVRHGDEHRAVKDLQIQLEFLNDDIEEVASEFRQHGGTGTVGPEGVNRITLQRMKKRLENLREIYEADKAELLDLGRTRLAINQLKRDRNRISGRLNATSTRIDQLNFELAGRNRIEVIDPGNWPVAPSSDGRKKKALTGLMGGGAAGFGLVFLFGALNQRYRYLDDAKSSVGHVRILGILPKLPEDLSHPEHAAIAAHCVHQIRTLLQIGRSEDAMALSVTSPAAGDGKTSLALALGLSYAASGCRTLLVDSDIIGGGLTQRLDIIVRRRLGRLLIDKGLLAEAQLQDCLEEAKASDRPLGEVVVSRGFVEQSDVEEALAEQANTRVGLIDVMQGEPLEAAVAETGMTNLSLLPLGSADIRDIGKLSPAGIRRLLRQGRQQYDVVLFDTGPSPGSLEASLVASEVDSVVLAVSRGEQRHMAEQAVKHLQGVGATVGGLVFNRAETRDVEIYGSTSRVSARSGSLNLEPFEDLQVGDPTEKSRYGPVAYVTARSLPENQSRSRRPSTTTDQQALPPGEDEGDPYS